MTPKIQVFDQKTSGIALLCDPQGIIVEVIQDELGLAPEVELGRSFTQSLDRDNFNKALNFLAELRTKKMCSNWELNIRHDQRIKTLFFSGVATNNYLLIFGTRSGANARHLVEDLMSINNEQASALRAVIKEYTELTKQQEVEASRYDELSRLNNELVSLQRDLAKKNAELERLNQQKDHFLGMAAHDLRNPLSVISMYSEYLLADTRGKIDDENLEFLTIIHESSQFLAQLVDDLLDVSTIASGKLTLQPWLVDLVEFIQRNITLNRILAERKQIHIHFRCQDDIPKIMIDAAKIEQVLNNLISNAIKFSNPDTNITITVSKQENWINITV
jgi:signal transduction histidine kinase